MDLKFGSVCSGVEMASVAWKPLGWKPAFLSEIDKFPCALLAHRYPDVPNFGDLTKIHCIDNKRGTYTYGDDKRADVGPVDVLVGGTPCFPAGTPVLTKKGYRPIENLKVGDTVIGGSGKVRVITAVGCKMANCGRLSVLGRGSIQCTPNHPFQTVATIGGNKIFPKTRADECKGVRATLIGRCEDGGYPNRDVATLCGWFIRRGRIFTLVSGDRSYCLGIPPDEYDVFRSQGMLHVDGVEVIANYLPSDERMMIKLQPSVVYDWIDTFMVNSEWGKSVKVIPPGFYNECDNMCDTLGAFLDGLFGGEKCSKLECMHPATAYGVADLVRGSVVSRRSDGLGYDVIIERTPSRFEDRVEMGCETTLARRYDHGTGMVPVYNITVDVDHTYVVCGCVVGNCQSFSISGKREGLEGVSGLVRSYFRLLGEMRPKLFVWENVKGSLSSNKGDDFRFILDQFTSLGYSCAWRVLDTEHVRTRGFPRAVPQRRKRLFVVGCLGTPWEVPAEILFDPDRLPGDAPPCRGQGPEDGVEVEARIGVYHSIPAQPGQAAVTFGKYFDLKGVRTCYDYHGNDMRVLPTAVAPTIAANNGDHQEGKEVLVMDEFPFTDEFRTYVNDFGLPTEIALMTMHDDGTVERIPVSCCERQSEALIAEGCIITVRRMMPHEVEALMGLPRNYTQIPYLGKRAEDCTDSHRFKACGNGFSVNVMQWIGERIEEVATRYNMFGGRYEVHS